MLQGVGMISLAGVDLAAEGRGRGEPLVLLHGFAGDRRLWDGVWDELAHGRYGLRYDLRGFGESQEHGAHSFSHATDLEALLDALRIERCDLLGVSMGGGVALNFALDHPERVRRLVLVSPAIVAWDWSDAWRARWRAIVETARSGDLDAARELWWRHPLFATTRASGVADTLRSSIMAYSGRHWLEPDREAPAQPDLERLHLLTTPTLLLTGSRDLEDFRLIADLIEAAAPDLRRRDFQGAGHLLHLERAKPFATQVIGFLDR